MTFAGFPFAAVPFAAVPFAAVPPIDLVGHVSVRWLHPTVSTAARLPVALADVVSNVVVLAVAPPTVQVVVTQP